MVKTGNLPVMFVILNVLVMWLLVGTTKYLNIKFWLQQFLALGNSPLMSMLNIMCSLLLQSFKKKDCAIKTEIQLYAVDRRGRKHSITKR